MCVTSNASMFRSMHPRTPKWPLARPPVTPLRLRGRIECCLLSSSSRQKLDRERRHTCKVARPAAINATAILEPSALPERVYAGGLAVAIIVAAVAVGCRFFAAMARSKLISADIVRVRKKSVTSHICASASDAAAAAAALHTHLLMYGPDQPIRRWPVFQGDAASRDRRVRLSWCNRG
jgi:hypothetical protein